MLQPPLAEGAFGFAFKVISFFAFGNPTFAFALAGAGPLTFCDAAKEELELPAEEDDAAVPKTLAFVIRAYKIASLAPSLQFLAECWRFPLTPQEIAGMSRRDGIL